MHTVKAAQAEASTVPRYTAFLFMCPVPILEGKKLSLLEFCSVLAHKWGKSTLKRDDACFSNSSYTQTNVCHIRYMVVK
jgi:hypothetical protein